MLFRTLLQLSFKLFCKVLPNFEGVVSVIVCLRKGGLGGVFICEVVGTIHLKQNSKEPTTKNKSLIDHLYTNIQHTNKTGTIKTYHKDHDKIFIYYWRNTQKIDSKPTAEKINHKENQKIKKRKKKKKC